MYDDSRLKAFESAYRAGLKKAIEDKPSDYLTKDADLVADKMLNSIRTKGIGAVSVRGSDGFKNACKTLGIKQTYKNIEAYLLGK